MENLLKCTNKDREKILAFYGKNERDVEDHVKECRDWLKEEEDIPTDLIDDKVIENLLIRVKFRMERFKTTLQNKYKYKKLYPDSYQYTGIHPKDSSCKIVIMPDLTEKCERVMYVHDGLNGKFDLHDFLKMFIVIDEFLLKYDSNNGFVLICEMKNFSTMDFLRNHLKLLPRVGGALLNAHSSRFLQVEFVNPTLFGPYLLSFMKAFVTNKIFNRFRFQKNYENLHQVVDKRILASDLDGLNGFTTDEIWGQWDRVIREEQEFLKGCKLQNKMT